MSHFFEPIFNENINSYKTIYIVCNKNSGKPIQAFDRRLDADNFCIFNTIGDLNNAKIVLEIPFTTTYIKPIKHNFIKNDYDIRSGPHLFNNDYDDDLFN